MSERETRPPARAEVAEAVIGRRSRPSVIWVIADRLARARARLARLKEEEGGNKG